MRVAGLERCQWSPQQDAAIRAVTAWIKDPRAPQVFRLFGYAGTGKTTLAKELAKAVKGPVLYATFTGKAALVLRKKGCEGASTIHSLIYQPHQNDTTGEVYFKLNDESALRDAKLLIVDEVSMVGEALARDLLSFGVKILVLGDPAQLPPVKDEGYFINATPDVMLTEVHRQAAENPIIRMSMDIREGNRLAWGAWGDSFVGTAKQLGRDKLGEAVLKAEQVLCGINRTRHTYNARIRAMKGYVGREQPFHPVAGEKLICLKNNKEQALFNGGMWQAESVKVRKGMLNLVVTSLDEQRSPVPVRVFDEFWIGTEANLDWRERQRSHEFTFGWTITTHKAQGSQWDNVLIFDESGAFRADQDKWLYTAITRAAERVTVIVP